MGVDPNQGMLAVACGSNDRIDWRVGTAKDIPSEDAAFDRLVRQFGMMFFADRDGTVREMTRMREDVLSERSSQPPPGA